MPDSAETGGRFPSKYGCHPGDHLRRQKVILDSDLARIYGVPTKRLNEQVRRNKERFPTDFVFRLNQVDEETLNRSQFATGSQKHRDPRLFPLAFTEHVAIMAATVLNSKQAVMMSVFVVRAFERLREALAVHKDLARKLEALEKKVGVQDAKIQAVFDAIKDLMKDPEKSKKRIGFLEEPKAAYRV
jgi:ORF6N domain